MFHVERLETAAAWPAPRRRRGQRSGQGEVEAQDLDPLDAGPHLEAELRHASSRPAVGVTRRLADEETTTDLEEAGGTFGGDRGWSEGASGDRAIAAAMSGVVGQHLGPTVVGRDLGEPQEVDGLVEEGDPAVPVRRAG